VALVIVLVLLLAITVLGVAGITTATLELQSAGNAQYHERAFEAAEHAIERALASPDLDTSSTPAEPVQPDCADECRTPVTDDPFDYSLYHDSGADSVPTPDAGHSIGTGLETYHFVIESEGESGRGARSEHVQGFAVIGPAED
jgi:Tfp pilus assembly protein PilV